MHAFERGSVGIGFVRQGHGRKPVLYLPVSPAALWDGGYTCFGRIISGMPAADHMVAGDAFLKVSIKDEVAWIDYRRY